MISYKEAHEVWRYDPDTGLLHWRVSPRSRTKAGDVAGGLNDGYIMVKYKSRCYLVHRLAWFMVRGEWPKEQIDHKDTDRSNNRWDNLREATREQNMSNKSAHKNNKLGVKGVYKIITDGKYISYMAQVKSRGKTFYLGCFRDIESAKVAHDDAASRIHGEFARIDV